MSGKDVLALLETPFPLDAEIAEHLSALGSLPIHPSDFPAPDSPQERALLAWATVIFLQGESEARCRERIALVLGTEPYNSLSLYHSYIRTSHVWLEMHPEISSEADQRVRDCLGPLLAEAPALAEFFFRYREKAKMLHFSGGEGEVSAEVQQATEHTHEILENISDAFYTLDREWRFTYVNAAAEPVLRRPREELVGKNIWAEFPEGIGTKPYLLYHLAAETGKMQAFEEYYTPLSTWFEVRAYPSADGVSIYFHDITERKAQESERERLTEHKGNIAQQLQAALTPSLHRDVPGLAVTKYYEAALEEAGVGGDFYDVFEMTEGSTALVVGDLSGKGLAAASEVALVRNMVHYAVYRARSLVVAFSSLNSVLAEQHLLSGFATLFVGSYESGTGLLSYVNCGQEPALVRRAGGAVELLKPTGPILGSFAGMAFAELTVTLLPGDALIIYTDGLTEALALHVIAGVDTAAQGGVIRDDVCLLVGVVR